MIELNYAHSIEQARNTINAIVPLRSYQFGDITVQQEQWSLTHQEDTLFLDLYPEVEGYTEEVQTALTTPTPTPDTSPATKSRSKSTPKTNPDAEP